MEQLQKVGLPEHCTGISKVMCSTLASLGFLLLSCLATVHIQLKFTLNTILGQSNDLFKITRNNMSVRKA